MKLLLPPPPSNLLLWNLGSNSQWTEIAKLCRSKDFWVLLFCPYFLNCSHSTKKDEDRKESGTDILIGRAWGNLCFFPTISCWLGSGGDRFCRKYHPVSLAKSSECDSRFFRETMDLAIQDYHIGSPTWVPALDQSWRVMHHRSFQSFP